MQLELEEAHVKNHLNKRLNSYWEEIGLLEAIEKEYSQEYDVSEWKPDMVLVAKMLTQVYLAKRLPIEVAVGMFSNKHEVNEILLTAHTLIQLKAVIWDGRRLVVRIPVSQEVEKELSLYQYPMPLVVEPEKITRNCDSGYLTFKKNIILRMKDSEGDCCIDVINTINSIPLVLDAKVTNFTKSPWKNLDAPKEKETQDEFVKRKKAYEKYLKDSIQVINGLLTTVDKVWLTHAYDKRGRIYANGYHVNPYGNDWSKAVVQFANKEVIQ